MLTQVCVNIGSGNGLVPDGTKPLPETMLTSHPKYSSIHLRAISQEMLMNFIQSICLEITV